MQNQPAESHLSFTCFRVFKNPNNYILLVHCLFTPILTERQIWHPPHVLASAQRKMVTNWDSLNEIYSSNIVSDLSLQLYHWYWKVSPKKKKRYILIKLTGQEIKYNYFFLKFLLVLSQFVTLPTKLGTSCLKLYSSLISILVSTLSGMVLPQTLMACLDWGGRRGSEGE